MDRSKNSPQSTQVTQFPETNISNKTTVANRPIGKIPGDLAAKVFVGLFWYTLMPTWMFHTSLKKQDSISYHQGLGTYKKIERTQKKIIRFSALLSFFLPSLHSEIINTVFDSRIISCALHDNIEILQCIKQIMEERGEPHISGKVRLFSV